MRRTSRFRALVEAPEILEMPGVQDALTARIAAEAGFEAVTCGGYASTAALIGANTAGARYSSGPGGTLYSEK